MQEHAKSQATAKMIEDALAERFGETCPVDADLQGWMSWRGSPAIACTCAFCRGGDARNILGRHDCGFALGIAPSGRYVFAYPAEPRRQAERAVKPAPISTVNIPELMASASQSTCRSSASRW